MLTFEALAQEALRQLDQGALAQIVGIGLEGQPQHRYAPLSVRAIRAIARSICC